MMRLKIHFSKFWFFLKTQKLTGPKANTQISLLVDCQVFNALLNMLSIVKFVQPIVVLCNLDKFRKYPICFPLFQGGEKLDASLPGQHKVFTKSERTKFCFKSSRAVRSRIYLFQGSAKSFQTQKVPRFFTTLPGRCEAWYSSFRAL